MSKNHHDSKSVTILIKGRMEKMELSQNALAMKAAVDRVHLNQFLNGLKQMGSDGLIRVLREVGLTLAPVSKRRLQSMGVIPKKKAGRPRKPRPAAVRPKIRVRVKTTRS